MPIQSLLVANRGEIAIRVMRAAAELGIRTVAVFSEDDARCLHTRKADVAAALSGRGPAAYLNARALVEIARQTGCDAVHPGYGFLSEQAAFARLCAEGGLTFVGPQPENLELFGDKARARDLAQRCDVPVLPGTLGATSLFEAQGFLASLGGAPIVLKAIAGGGGRGMRVVRHGGELADAFERASSEANAAFGNGDLYVEQCVARARHVEVQVVGDGESVAHLWERECTLQRRHQKLVEVAPSPGLAPELRDALIASALELAEETVYESLGTFEFLIDADAAPGSSTFAFIEANARLQVEHTVTEEVTGFDLVRAQLEIAGGRSLAELGLDPGAPPEPRGFAVQVRVNMERMGPGGEARPSGGTLRVFEPPSGPGLRADTFGYAGYTTSPSFDSLLLKLVAHSPSPRFADAVAKAYRALCELRIEGVRTNTGFLRSLLRHPDVEANRVTTRFVEEHAAELLRSEEDGHRQLFFARDSEEADRDTSGLAGARIDSRDPLAVLEHGKQTASTGRAEALRASPKAPSRPGPRSREPS